MDRSETRAPGTSGLRASAVSVPGVVFFVVAAAAPLGATLGTAPVVFMANERGAPGIYVIAGITLLLFATGYAAMSRYVTNAGGFAAFASRGIGRPFGLACGAVALLAYNCMLFGIYGQFGTFVESVADSKLGWSIPWWAAALGAVALVAVFGYLDVNLSARILGLLMVLEVLILVIFDAVVIAKGGAQGIGAGSFAPDKVMDGDTGVALLFAFSCFVGFEATTIYGEEARDPRRTIPRATYITVVLIGVFYVVTMWAVNLALPAGTGAKTAEGDPANFVFGLNSEYVGAWSTDVMNVLVVTSLFAVLLAFHNTLTRYMFALSRARFLPLPLSRTHPVHQSPHAASVVQAVLSAAALVIFMLTGADPFTRLYTLFVGLGTAGVLTLQATVAIAVIVFFRRPAQRRPWTRLVPSILGAAGLVAALVLAIGNFDVLAGAASGPLTLLPWLLPLAAVAGLVIGAVRRRQGIVVDLAAAPRPGTENDNEQVR